MIVKLIKDFGKHKKGQTIVTTKAVGVKLCEDEIAVSNTDHPCKPKAKTRKKKSPKMEVKIDNKL